MSDDRHPLQETNRDEEFLFFSGNTEDQACIGHLRGDFGSGTEFWATWWDHNEELKGQEFKDELDAVVNALRKDGPLKNLSSMERYCRSHAQARMSPASGTDYYGFRVDTEKHRYYLRFLPGRGDYNFCIYCYQTDKFERMADSPYREVSESSRTIKVLVVEPMKPCEVREISSLDDMQKIVGGNIEAVYPFTDPVAVVCNAEGKNLDLPYNRPLCDRSGIPYDILCGTFFIAGAGTKDFLSLTDEQIRSYKELYDNVMVITAEKETPPQKHSQSKKKRGNQHER
nr:DUF3846 domain-containing protein [uncultured Oscillibacter sp.]